jgi:hypothetical protein
MFISAKGALTHVRATDTISGKSRLHNFIPSKYGGDDMKINETRLVLAGAAILYAAAASVHFGWLTSGYEHSQAGTAETVIAAVLFGGLLVSFLKPVWTRVAAIVVQSFAVLLTFVGLFTIAIGVGPRTGPDLILHACMLALLFFGLYMTIRSDGTHKVPLTGPSLRPR